MLNGSVVERTSTSIVWLSEDLLSHVTIRWVCFNGAPEVRVVTVYDAAFVARMTNYYPAGVNPELLLRLGVWQLSRHMN